MENIALFFFLVEVLIDEIVKHLNSRRRLNSFGKFEKYLKRVIGAISPPFSFFSTFLFGILSEK